MNTWITTKKLVDDLPSNFEGVISKSFMNEGMFSSKNPLGVKLSKKGKMDKAEVYLPKINDFDVKLVVYTAKNKEVKESWYVAFNNETNEVYKRTLQRSEFKKKSKFTSYK